MSSDNPNDGTFGLPLEYHPKPSDEVKAAIKRAGSKGFHLWGSCGPPEAACFLRSLANEDAVMKMMADTYEASGGDGPHSDFMCNNMRAALLALARECE